MDLKGKERMSENFEKISLRVFLLNLNDNIKMTAAFARNTNRRQVDARPIKSLWKKKGWDQTQAEGVIPVTGDR